MRTAWAAQGSQQGYGCVSLPLVTPLPPRRRPRPHRLTTCHCTVRVLRYPDGRERRIIYPQEAVTDEGDDNSGMDSVDVVGSEDWGWDISFGLKQQTSGAKRQRPTTYKRVNGPSARLTPQVHHEVHCLAYDMSSMTAADKTQLLRFAQLAPAAQRAVNASEVASTRDMAKQDVPPRMGSTESGTGSEMAAYLDSLFAATMDVSQPEVDVEGCYQVRNGFDLRLMFLVYLE